MAKKDAASKRLAKEIALAELLKKVPPPFWQEELLAAPPAPEELLAPPAPEELLAPPAPEELLAPPAPEELPGLFQLGGPRHAGLGSYGRDASERPILDAFKAFGLDHRSLSDWRALVSHLASVLFPTPRPQGAPRKWTDERLCKLLADVAAYKRKNPEASDTAICSWLSKKWSKEPATLRRVLQDARNPARNDLLARMAYDLMMTPQVREAARAMTDEKKLRSRMIWWAIQNADKLWGQ